MTARIAADSDGHCLSLRLEGCWRLGTAPTAGQWQARLAGHRRLALQVADSADWDSSLPAFVRSLAASAQQRSLETSISGPERLQKLLTLALAAANRDHSAASAAPASRWWPDLGPPLRFIGQLLLALRPGQKRPQTRELLRVARQCSSRAMPIVALVNFLVGGILAFIGAVQLRTFGAEIFVADMVGIATAREMAALITAVVLAGRLAAAFAAEIATMQGNEEIDALRTVQVDAVSYLVVPRVLSLLLATPVLFVGASVSALIGGLTVAVLLLDIPVFSYVVQTRDAVSLTQFGIGFVKALVFSAFLAAAGCYFGLRAARNAAAVGDATTRAVVTSIVGIICIDAAGAVICDAFGI